MIDQEELHNQCLSEDPKERIKALKKLTANFLQLPEKQKAWSDLISLTTDKYSSVRFEASSALVFAFTHVSDKEQALNDLHELTTDKNSNVRSSAVYVLGSVITHVPDKQRVWEDFHRLTTDKDGYVRYLTVSALVSGFSQLPDKQQAWEDIFKLTVENWTLRQTIVSSLCSIFPDVPDKNQAWNDLHKLAEAKDLFLRYCAVLSIGYVFSDIPNKNQAWNDLHRFTEDESVYLRYGVASSLGSAFFYIPNKIQAWNDLHKLTGDKIKKIRSAAVYSMVSAFPYIPSKDLVWDDLIKLTQDEDWIVSWDAASSLGSVFPYVPDKDKAWNDLNNLVKNKNIDIRKHVNSSLGKACIFKASQAEKEEDYKKELEKAILFFEEASLEAKWDNSSQFCLPFYRSFYAIIFKKQEAKEVVGTYLAEVKSAVKGSKSKELLFEAVENLANALKEVQNLENLDLETKKCELNFYRQYCDRAAELMRDTEKAAPFATIAMRKGLPILNRNLKELLEEIQKKAKIACKESKGTDAEEIACAISKEVQKWEISSQGEMTQNIEDLIQIFRLRMPHLEGYEHIFEEIEGIRNETDLVQQYKIVSRIVGLVPMFSSMPDHVVQDIKEIKEKTTSLSNEFKYLQLSVDRLIASVDELQNPQEFLDTIQQNLEEIKNDIPEMKGKIDEVLYKLYSPLSTTQKLKVAIPIIPSLVSYEMETDVPKLVADKIDQLKNLVLRFKKSE